MIRRKGLRAAVAACAATALLATPALAGTAGPGAAGVGDSYYPKAGNGGYDVSHYDIRLRYQPNNDHLHGTTTIVATPTKDLTTFNLDFALKIQTVRVNGLIAEFTRKGPTEVTVDPRYNLPAGSLAIVTVRYQGKPSTVEVDGYNPWLHTKHGTIALNEPQIAEWWFPSSDHPTDKATFDIEITVPKGYEAISNGVLTGKSNRFGWTTWDWRMSSPSATYLAFMTIGQYEIHKKTGAFGQPFLTAYHEDLGKYEGAAKASIGRSPEVLQFLTDMIDAEYPFKAQGGVVPFEPKLGFALETQTRPVYSHLFFQSGSNLSVVVHELAHQWFGDSVSVQDWSDIWINEGFATFSTWMWSEKHGTGSAQQIFDYYYSNIPADASFWQVTPGNPGRENLFHGSVYIRGAMTLQALRNRVGTETLFDTMSTWVKVNRNSHATVREFIALAEKVSGEQLDKLFDKWLFTPGKPEVSKQNGTRQATTMAAQRKPKIVEELNLTRELLSHNHG